MTVNELQRLVRIVGNQTYVRYWLMLDFPNPPKRMGFQTHPPTRPKMKHERHFISQLMADGFRYDKELDMWIAERTEA